MIPKSGNRFSDQIMPKGKPARVRVQRIRKVLAIFQPIALASGPS